MSENYTNLASHGSLPLSVSALLDSLSLWQQLPLQVRESLIGLRLGLRLHFAVAHSEHPSLHASVRLSSLQSVHLLSLRLRELAARDQVSMRQSDLVLSRSS